ncbi:TPA: restriction endonuclease subunit S [Vibrio cholerae]|uniref:restriction endonuclease subunit S n=1 Tax=Vibrio cholerae TaxID=666 RepID=UPI00226DEB5F|nr:restriction endonuclease subunit S [Vibrio cholerae]EKF9436494.1 restriction endonuclease subunit S [Vibrio cholerae]MCX9449497.1 restriction endonuclease subunit S [Vibrio cholerae]
MAVENLITEHIDIWTSAVKTKSTSGRGSSKKLELYGVKKLRELILELAVRGKLVPQDPSDEPASVLLERIAQEKAQLVKEKKIKKPKALPEITDEEKPFELPSGWEWSRLGNIITASTGFAFKTSQYVEKGIFVLRVTNINVDGTINFFDNKYISEEIASSTYSNYQLFENDLLLVMVGGSLGKIGIVSKDVLPAVLNQNMWKLNPFGEIPVYYLKHGLGYINRNLLNITASTHGHLAQGDYLNKPFPLAPLKEQHRIVAKVDELMALCDQLEQQTEASIEAHQVLVTTLLDTLTNSADADELMQNWARISEHFDTLFTTEESIDQLKQTILQLAVMGKLVPQDPTDEPASELLKRIAEEKAQLVKEKKIKKEKALPPISEDEKPFELPNGWGFAHMQDLCELITDGTHQTPKYTDTGRPFISAQCVKPFRFMPENCRYVSEEHYQAYIKNRNPEFRDILLSRVGAGIGEAAMIDTDLEFAIYVSTGLLKPHKSSVMSEYLVLWLNSPLGRGFSERNTLGKGVSQGNLNLSLIRAFTVSLPPLQEQKRIIEQVNKLSDLCDLLKERLQSVQLTQLSLTDVITEQVV